MEIWFLKLLWVRFWASSTLWWEFQLCCCTAQLLGQFWPQASNISIQSFAGKTSIFTFTKWPLTWWHYLGVKRNQQIFRRRRPCPLYRLIPWATLRSTTLQSGTTISIKPSFIISIRGSITSFHKVSRNSSFRRDTIANCGPDGDEDGGGGGLGANKESQSVLKNLMKNIKQKSEEEQGFSFLEV